MAWLRDAKGPTILGVSLFCVLALGACGANTQNIPCTSLADCPVGYACQAKVCVPGGADAGIRRYDSGTRREGKPTPPDAPRSLDAGVPCGAPPSGIRYVDASYAGKTHTGTKVCPFMTITAALGSLGSSSTATTIYVEPGVYDAKVGEKFPLSVPGNVTIDGDNPGSLTRDSFVIDGDGPATDPRSGGAITTTVELQGTIEYMHIKDSLARPAALVLATEGTPHLATVTVSGGMDGVWALGAASLTIDSQSDVRDATGDGVLLDAVDSTGGALKPTFLTTTSAYHANGGDGIDIADAAMVQIGPGAAMCTTPGGPVSSLTVVIFCNGKFGVESSLPASSVGAEDDFWNHLTPTSGGLDPDINSVSNVNASCPAGAAPGACTT